MHTRDRGRILHTMPATLYPPHCPQVPSNNVYVGARIADHVVNYAPVFINHTTKTVSAVRRARNVFLGASTVTKEKAKTGKRKRTETENDVSVAVNGSVTFMCEKGAVKPGRWVGVPGAGASATELTSKKECCPIEEYTAANAANVDPIGVCLAVADDQLSATVLLRRDAFLFKTR